MRIDSRPSSARRRCFAFTIIELLTVIAIIGILAGILIPTVAGTTRSAKRNKTKVQFSQWALAIEGFRQEYGYYPNFPSNLVNDLPAAVQANYVLFQELLSGRGAVNPASFLSAESSSAQNKKRIHFISFAQGDLSAGKLVDGFGNGEIAVLVDKDQNGIISINAAGDYAPADVPLVKGMKPTFPPYPDGIRAGVIFYSPGSGESASDIVKSWE